MTIFSVQLWEDTRRYSFPELPFIEDQEQHKKVSQKKVVSIETVWISCSIDACVYLMLFAHMDSSSFFVPEGFLQNRRVCWEHTEKQTDRKENIALGGLVYVHLLAHSLIYKYFWRKKLCDLDSLDKRHVGQRIRFPVVHSQVSIIGR